MYTLHAGSTAAMHSMQAYGDNEILSNLIPKMDVISIEEDAGWAALEVRMFRSTEKPQICRVPCYSSRYASHSACSGISASSTYVLY